MRQMPKKVFKTAFCVCILSLLVYCLAGCTGPAAGETKEEVVRRHKRIYNNQALERQDDVDAILMIDRPSRLSDKIQR